MIVLEAETAQTVGKALADNVAGRIFAPPLRVSACYYLGIGPAYVLGLGVEKPRPLLTFIIITATAAMSMGR